MKIASLVLLASIGATLVACAAPFGREVEDEVLGTVTLALGTVPVRKPTSLLELLRRPELAHGQLRRFATLSDDAAVAERVEVIVKYDGYLRRQEAEAARLQRLESMAIPDDVDYATLRGLSHEAREKLGGTRPRSLGQAARIAGVTPAAVSILATHLEARRR